MWEIPGSSRKQVPLEWTETFGVLLNGSHNPLGFHSAFAIEMPHGDSSICGTFNLGYQANRFLVFSRHSVFLTLKTGFALLDGGMCEGLIQSGIVQDFPLGRSQRTSRLQGRSLNFLKLGNPSRVTTGPQGPPSQAPEMLSLYVSYERPPGFL